jgi:alpha-L-rhamnosidase
MRPPRPALLRPLFAFSALTLSLLAAANGGTSPPAAAPLTLDRLRVEYQTDPLGIDVRRPRLSWELRSEARGVMQSAWQVKVAESPAALAAGRGLLWDSGKVPSDASTHREYAGPDLRSGGRYAWRVRVWDGEGRATSWSAPASFEMGLLSPADWTASWIEPGWAEDTTSSQPATMLRSTFEVSGRVRSARAYITSHGVYEAHLNGRRVGDLVLTPGWTTYDKRLQYQTYDVTALLRPGRNAVGAMLGDGWYRGWLAWQNNRNTWGSRTGLLLQLRIVYTDGREQVFGTDASWKGIGSGPVRTSDIYMGETYDARMEKDGWTLPGYDDHDWSAVRVADHDKNLLVAPVGPPVRRVEEIRPVKVLRTPAGETVYDMGQNLVGWVRLRVRGSAGTTVRMRHAEVLDRNGNFYTANLRAAKQEVRYILKGVGEEVYEPRFSFQGFRYVAVEGLPGEPALDALTGIVVHSDMERTGSFETSDSLLNQLQHNIIWGQKGNFVDVPTDCPQRDERLGWTGDAQVFARTAAFNHDVAGFFGKWLADLAADQLPDGRVPHVIPNALRKDRNAGGSAAWSDASTIIPWTMYLVYGDARLLERQYPSMKGWVEHMRQRAGDSYLWTNGTHFGDWLAYATTRSDYPGATTDKDLIATAFYAHSTDLLRRAAVVLGKEAEAREYGALFEQVRAAFQREYVTASGRMSSNTQTAYAIALEFDLLPEGMRAAAAQRLVSDVRAFRSHLTTGFVGTPYLTHVLSRSGHTDVAYELLNQRTYPSWLYPVLQGATTIWERWDGQKPDGSFQDPGMNSFNHYAYGAIGDWLYRVVAGLELDPAEPAYKHIVIQPSPGGGLTHARAALRSMYGEIAAGWELSADRLTVQVTVPPNTRATIRLPGAALAAVTEGGTAVARAAGVTRATQEGDVVVVEAGSGRYSFSYPFTAPRAGN